MENEQLELPPGFRFYPSDEELITHYLAPKVLDSEFEALGIAMVDLNKVEPWELPWMAKMGDKEWYFFCMRDRKYPTGLRTNRATEAGYWKATGKDKEIYRAKSLVGMKKTLVFYRGRAPKGEKTNWVMHEYRKEGKDFTNYLPKSKNEWVICRIFHKSVDGKKMPISALERFRTIHGDNKLPNSDLPPLLDLSPFDAQITGTSHVTCFSDQTINVKPHDHNFDNSFNSNICNDATPLSSSSSVSLQSSYFSTPFLPHGENIDYSGPNWMQDESLLKILIENSIYNNVEKSFKEELCEDQELEQRSYEDDEYNYYPNGSVDLDCLWNY